MKTGAIFLILFSCFTLNAMAANTTTVLGYPNGQPTTVCASTSANNQCLGQGGGGGGSGNVGIGTTTRIPVYQDVATIGSPYNNVMDSNGNVGVGSANPGTILDVFGSERILNSGTLKISALTASRPALIDSSSQLGTGTYSGNTTTFATTTGALTNGNFASWDASGNAVASGTANSAAGIVGLFSTCSGTQYLGADGACHTASGTNFWLLQSSGNIGISTVQNVGIGTSFVGGAGEAGLAVMTGNIGVGTWIPSATLSIVGNIGIGTELNSDPYLRVSPPNGGVLVSGNVGIGTWLPKTLVDINGQLYIGTISQTVNGSGQKTDITTSANTGGWGLGWSNEHGTGNVSGLGNGIMGYVNCTGSLNACSTITQVSGHGSLMGGDMEVTSGQSTLFNSTANGAFGWVNSSAATGNAGFSITQSGNGSWVGGNIENSGSTVGFTASGKGCLVFGDIIGSGSNSNFNCTAQGAIAMGVSNSGIIQASGRASIALGENVQANGNDTVSIGSAVINGQPATIAMGFTATPAFLMQGSNIGLGTITPLATIQIVGNIGIGTVANGDLFITTSPPKGGMIIENNVGIGTVTPGQALDVNGAGRFLGTGNTLLNPTSGNVGIGTTNPQAALDLGTSGQIRSNNTSGMGCKVKTGANTACNTTCSGGGCFIGFDTGLGSSDIVSCTDATADSCVCCNPA